MAPAVGQAGGGSLKTRNHRAGTCTGDPGPGGPGRRGAMWQERAVSLCSCIALLPLIVACTGGPGSPPQAYAPPAPSSPPSFAAIQTGLTPRYAAPAAEAAALPYQAAGVPAGPGGVYTVAARTSPGAIIVMLPGAGAVFPTDPALWAAQGFDVVAPPPAELYRLAAVQE